MHSRPIRMGTWAGWLLLAGVGTAVFGAERPWPEAMLDDADLCDVCFVDAGHGWAVGDRGAIWHTDDGGRNWRRQAAPVACRLEAVTFVDPQHGWIVGGRSMPRTHRPRGVVLRTTDGGANWQLAANPTLPWLRIVKFFDTRSGWAAGDGSAMYPAGLFFTDDGGRHWTTVAQGGGHRWLAGDFRDPQRGVLAAADATLAIATREGLLPLRQPAASTQQNAATSAAAHVAFDQSGAGLLIRTDGSVMRSADGGLSWRPAAGPLPPGPSQHFRLTTAATHGAHCWIAGDPGTVVFHSPDGGKTWEALPTGQTLPIRALTFTSPMQGWAVGCLGTILATDDGGRTWRRQRGSAARLAVLGVFADPTRVPFEAFAHGCGNDGYLGRLELIGHRMDEINSPRHAPLAARTHQAMLAVGGGGADIAQRFPLPVADLRLSAEKIIAGWDAANGGQGLAALEAHLVRRLRVWRPEVVITEPTRDDDAATQLVHRLTTRAIEQAASATAHADQQRAAGLRPWTVKKVWAVCDPRQSAPVTIAATQLAPSIGRSLADMADDARQCIFDSDADRIIAGPSTTALRPVAMSQSVATNERRLFGGVSLTPGGAARRRAVPPVTTNLARLRQLAHRRRNIEQLLAGAASSGAWMSQLGAATAELDADSTAELLLQLGWRFHQAGRSAQAAETMQLLVQQHPQHDAAEAALVWLLHYCGSAEMAWREHDAAQPTAKLVGDVESTPPTGLAPVVQATPGVDTPRAHDPVAPATHEHAGNADTNRAQRTLAVARFLRSQRPDLFAEPMIQLPLAAAHRSLGDRQQATFVYRDPLAARWRDAWQRCLLQEYRLDNDAQSLGNTSWRCAAAESRPWLDGALDDPVWQAAEPITLTGPSPAEPASAQLAYDDQFLYLAVQCRQAPGAKYAVTDAPRNRDADLGVHDRINLLLDVDRDRATCWRLTVDHRGWTGEACWGDRTWNPQWFVAAQTRQGAWTAEAAIAWDQLVATPPTRGGVWCADIRRIIPGVGAQSWSQSATPQVRPERFGLLTFQ